MNRIVTSIFTAFLVAFTLAVSAAEPIAAQDALVNSEAAMILNPEADDRPDAGQARDRDATITALFRKAPYLIYPGVSASCGAATGWRPTRSCC